MTDENRRMFKGAFLIAGVILMTIGFWMTFGPTSAVFFLGAFCILLALGPRR